MNPHFRKGNKAKHGSGHLWVLADIEEDQTVQKIIQEVQNAAAAAAAAAATTTTASTTTSSEPPADHEDEAAKAVRSILGHNDSIDENKENAVEVKSRSSSRLRERNEDYHHHSGRPTAQPQVQQQAGNGIKRPACSAVEIQYVTSESKLDAPGNFCTYL